MKLLDRLSYTLHYTKIHVIIYWKCLSSGGVSQLNQHYAEIKTREANYDL